MQKWITNKNYTFYDNITNLKISDFEFMFIFDLDNTLIKTKSGKVFPINGNDWIFNYDFIPKFLNNLDKTLIGIISNQKGLKTDTQIIEWQNKLNNIMKYINVNFIFSSFKDDRYRKPMIGSWNYLKDIVQNLNILENKIIYIGDAAGRIEDHNDTDLKFAQNCNFKFNTPEKFFKIKTPKQIMTITYPKLEYYTKKEFNNIIKTITNNFTKEQILIIMIGLPSCGKSFIRKLFINKYTNFKYNNKDDIKNKIINDNLIIKHDKNIKYIIDDNTNINTKQRNELFKIYNTHYKIGIYFNFDIDTIMHLNYMRMYWYDAELIKKIVYNTLNKKTEKPEKTEFDLLIEINKIIPDFNLETNIKYYF
jgi:bifunctional polynucleotide phosphatase/kinase